MSASSLPEFFSSQIAEAKRFHLDHMAAGRAPLTVVSGGREHCQPDYEVQRRSFPFWGLEFVAQGSGKVVLANKPAAITAGSVFSYGPKTAHHIVTDRDSPLVKYFVDFSGSRAAGLMRSLGPAPGFVVQTSAPGEVMAVFDDLIRNGLTHTPFSGRITAIMLEHLLLKIAETAIPNGSAVSPAFTTYRRCRQFIQDHWMELDSLCQIGTACHLDPAYLCRLFRKFDRQSPYQLLLRLKIQHAATRLRTGHTPVAVVAEELRFADAFHFSRVFKKLMGVSPRIFARLREG